MATTSRVISGPNQDQTGRLITRDFKSLAYAATIALKIGTQMEWTMVKVAQLTGALTLTVGVGAAGVAPFVGDKLELLFTADGTNRVVTFGTGFVSTGTLTVTASKGAYASFIFNGTAWQEMSRAIYA